MLSHSRSSLRSRCSALALAVVAAIAVWLIPQALVMRAEQSGAHKPAVAYLGSAEKLHAAYTRWAADHEAQGGDRHVTFALGWSKGLSAEFTEAVGLARLDLIGGSISVEVRGLPETIPSEVWLVDNQPGAGRSVKPEPGDKTLFVGRLRAADGVSRLEAQLGPRALAEFEVDLVVVARPGGDIGKRGLLFAAPSLFQRLYTRARLGRPAAPANEGGLLLASLGRQLAHAAPPVASLDPLVVQGSQLFFDETFDGNGRTCGTCHPAQNNLTIDPKFIATLPPNDPLFVAEFTPALSANFENPKLMRQVGLILENLDGFGNLANRFVMRGVPHILALNTSLTPSTFDGTTVPPKERTGWSGDGAPGSGTLREFAIGAVTQHFTRTLNRVPGVDFRLPTDEELDALEAFQRFVGRNQDPDLATLRLKGAVPRRGLEIFLTDDTKQGTVAAGKCGQCHGNAGASAGGVNSNFATGIEQLTETPADLIDPLRNPPDGGFGTAHVKGVPGFGNGTFNTPPLVEAADTGPFFHNNAVSTIEGAVSFFNSETFNASPSGQFLASQDTGGIGIRLEPAQIEAIAAFLRVLNALENIRGSIELLRFTLDVQADSVANRLLRLAIQEQQDAVQVLNGAGLHPVAVQHLNSAIERTRLAIAASPVAARNVVIRQAIARERAARLDMVEQ
jgi:cytochrome c peroxidase